MLKILIPRLDEDNVQYTTITLAVLFAIVDRDPMVPYKWMKENRLSLLSIPGQKVDSCDDVRMLRSKGKKLGLTEKDVGMLEVLGEFIKPLEGM